MTSSQTVKNAAAFVLLGLTTAGPPALAQAPTLRQPEPDNPLVHVKYGSTVTSSFVQGNQLHRYALHVKSDGDRVRITVKPAGETLRTSLALFDAADNLIDSSPKLVTGGRGQRGNRSRLSLRMSRGLAGPELLSKSLSADGIYHVEVYNGMGGVGKYQLLIEGLLPNGAVISAGAPPADPAEPGTPGVGGEPAAPAVGFPGLPPVDFSDAVMNDLPADGAIHGKIASDRDRIVRGYTYAPREGGASELSLRRTKGTGLLGFVVLSEKNEVLAQSTLIASDQVVTTLAFPQGAATLGVFRLDSSMKVRAQWPTEFELRVRPAPSGGGR